MPNYIGAVKAARIRKAHFVVTSAMKEKAKQLECIFKKHGIAVEMHDLADTTPSLIFALLERIRIQFQSNPDVNVTGGNKIMSLTATEWANMNEYLPFYVDTEKSRLLIIRNQFETIPLASKISVRELIEVHGYYFAKTDAPQTASIPNREILMELTEYAIGHPDQLKEANRDISEAARINSLSCEISNPSEADLFSIFKKAGKADMTSSGRVIFSDDLSREWCRGKWLEDYVHAVLYKMQMDKKIDDWSKSFSIYSSKEDASKASQPYYKMEGFNNEFDAAFTRSGQLAVIECKTINIPKFGKVSKDAENKVSDIAYKLDSLTKKAGGTFAKGVLVSVNDVPKQDQKRLKDAGHRLITGRKILNLSDELTGLFQ